jgi:hypothetical protein
MIKVRFSGEKYQLKSDDEDHTIQASRSYISLPRKCNFVIMKIIIAGERSLQEIQHEFNAAYPYLKIEFFPPQHKKPSPAATRLGKVLRIDEARKQRNTGDLMLDDELKVSELEKELSEIYGLNAQVFRKSGNIWLETTMTDGWTLKQQNDHGRELSNFTHIIL